MYYIFYPFFCWGRPRLFLTSAIMNKTTVNTVEQVSLRSDGVSFEYMPKSDMVGSWGRSIPNYLRSCYHLDFLSDGDAKHSVFIPSQSTSTTFLVSSVNPVILKSSNNLIAPNFVSLEALRLCSHELYSTTVVNSISMFKESPRLRCHKLNSLSSPSLLYILCPYLHSPCLHLFLISTRNTQKMYESMKDKPNFFWS